MKSTSTAPAPTPSMRERLGLKPAKPAAAVSVVPFPAPPATAPELTDDDREAFAIELVANPLEKKRLQDARQHRDIVRLGSEAENKRRAERGLPLLQVPAGPTRPYFVGTFPQLPPREQCAEIFAAAGLDAAAISALIAPDERKFLRRKQGKINAVNDQTKRLNADGIRAMAIEAEQRLKRGKGSAADANFDKGNLVAARKELRRQREHLIKECSPTLEKIAERIQQAARKALPTFEAEAQRLKINPGLLPMVMAAAALCYRPAMEAKNTYLSPKTWLKTNFGIRL